MFAKLLRKWTSPAPTVYRRATPRVELLEDRCVPATSIAEYPLAANSMPFAITTGPDGNIWFTENQANKIGVINIITKAVTEYAIPTANSGPTGITTGPDGNLWFTASGSNRIGMFNPTTRTFNDYAIPTANSQPVGIIAGPDGNLWFAEMAAGRIGMINPTTKAFSEFGLPNASAQPMSLAVGADGNIWFTENAISRVGFINPTTRAITDYNTPSPNSQPVGIVAGADGNLWFTEKNTNRIVKLNPNNASMIEYAVPARNGTPLSLTYGADGNIWFVESVPNQIGRLNPSTGLFTEFTIPTANSSPTWITTAPNGTIWFTEMTSSRIGLVVVSPVIKTAPVAAEVTEGQNATFTAAANGAPIPSVQWQVSTDGGTTFTNLTNAGVYSGVTTGTLTITGTTTSMSGYRYRALFTNGIAPSTTTTSVALTVNSILSLTPAAPPQGVEGVTYNQILTVAGSPAPISTLTVSNFDGGTTGLTTSNIATDLLFGTITISGTPTGAGTITFTVSVANLAGNTLTKTLTITIQPPLAIATPSLPSGTSGVLYNQTITVLGGAQPYTTFSVTNFDGGTTGLTASQVTANATTGTFVINGTPSAVGTATFTVNVTDQGGATQTKTFTILVNPALSITPSLPQGTAGKSYQQTLTVTGGGLPYATLSITDFNATTTGFSASNIVTNVNTGVVTINGTPSAAGTISFTVNVVDTAGATLTKSYTITINPAMTITAGLLPGTAGALFKQTITVTHGSVPYTTFNFAGFNGGTTGLSASMITADAATGRFMINGTPTAAGTATFTVNVVDSAGASLTKTFTISINPTLIVSALTTTQWTAGVAGFSGTMTISGGTPPHAIFSVSGLPSGLTAFIAGNTIAFAGAPTAVGAFTNGSITVRDAAGAMFTRTFSLTINNVPTITALSANQWTQGRPGFNGTMTASNGTGGFTIASSAGVPAGMSLVLNGTTLSFTGAPTTAGTFGGSVTLRDAVGATFIRTFAIIVNAAPTIGNLTVTQWTAGHAGFNGVLNINAGTTPHTITSVTGLPTGMSAIIDGTQIRFTGTPTTAQTANASITISDAAGGTVTKTFTITINPAPVITTPSFAAARMGFLYNAAVQSTGGTGPVTYAITAGSLPPGIKLSSNGAISGVSRGYGTFTFTITALDAVGAKVSKQYTLVLALR